MLLAEIQGQEFVDILKMIAPGTQIREGIPGFGGYCFRKAASGRCPGHRGK